MFFFFFFQAEDGIRDYKVTGVQTCALPIWAVRLLPCAAVPDAVPRAAGARGHDPGCGDAERVPSPGRVSRHGWVHARAPARGEGRGFHLHVPERAQPAELRPRPSLRRGRPGAGLRGAARRGRAARLADAPGRGGTLARSLAPPTRPRPGTAPPHVGRYRAARPTRPPRRPPRARGPRSCPQPGDGPPAQLPLPHVALPREAEG